MNKLELIKEKEEMIEFIKKYEKEIKKYMFDVEE